MAEEQRTHRLSAEPAVVPDEPESRPTAAAAQATAEDGDTAAVVLGAAAGTIAGALLGPVGAVVGALAGGALAGTVTGDSVNEADPDHQ